MAFLPAMMIASTAVSVIGAGAKGLAEHNSAKFQEKLAKVQAGQAQAQASVKASEVARDTKQTMASARASALQNGFALTGSMKDLLDQTERRGELDYLTAVYDGSVQAAGLRATAQNYKRQASNALISGAIGMGSEALSGITNIAKMKTNSLSVAGT